MKKLRVDVWSDVACPWCYVGKRHLEAALARFAHRDQVEVVWRAFELDSSGKRSQGRQVERLAEKYGMSVAEATQRLAAMTELGAKDGIAFDFNRVRSANTFDAHRLLHLGQIRGVQNELKERLLRAYFGEGVDLADARQLERLGVEAALDAAEVAAVLAGDAYGDDVRADEAEARELGIHGVPFFVMGRYGISGAQPEESLLEALERAWGEVPAEASASAARAN